MANDPKEIWLEPACCADPHSGRLWAEDNPFPECDDGVQPTRYIRADLAALSASPAPAGDLVERVALIIDPEAFDHPTVHPQHLTARRKAARDKARALIARLTEQVSGMDWLSSRTNLELSYDYGFDDDEPGWVIHRVTGPINDREWEEVARAPTVAAAIQTARETLTLMEKTDD